MRNNAFDVGTSRDSVRASFVTATCNLAVRVLCWSWRDYDHTFSMDSLTIAITTMWCKFMYPSDVSSTKSWIRTELIFLEVLEKFLIRHSDSGKAPGTCGLNDIGA